ncbi:MAG: heat-inducible transcription repressor HrcA [Gammaproteobacteria bacterium]|nr:heat-inducible transcription repressor HrcA [Gammaproteobacteria bacterium]
MNKNPLNERSQRILGALIARYIREGQPVGSKTISEEEASLSLSSATIRNILAELEEAGYLSSPHTSAGRVPTVMGYRLFVNNLLRVQNDSNCKEGEGAPFHLNAHTSEQELIESASNLISSLTRLTGIVTIPRHEQITFRHIEFLPLSHNRVLVILVLNEQEVQNLIIQTDKEYSESELQQAANFLMMHYIGKNLIEIRQALLNEMRTDHQCMDQIMHTVFDVAEKNLQKQQEDYVIAGESNLLKIAEENGVGQLRMLFDVFSRKHDILHLLDQCIRTEGIQIFIGQESGYEVFDGCSLITAPYAVGEKVLGVLGVIGPTRMNYQQVISAVDITAKLLSSILKDRLTSPE